MPSYWPIWIFTSPNSSGHASMALFTFSVTVSFCSRIFRGKLMPTDTVGLSMVFRYEALTSKNIFYWSNCFKMIRIYTKSVSTKMIQMKSDWYGSVFKFVRKSMCKIVSVFESELSVFSTFGFFKNPALACFCYEFPKILFFIGSHFRFSILETARGQTG